MNQNSYSSRLSRFVLASVLLFAGSLGLNAQSLFNYNFTASTATYTQISGGTQVATIQGDDISTVAGAIPIGFSFNYFGTTYTTLGANSNGFLFLGATAPGGATYSNLNTNGGIAGPIIAPLWRDLLGATGATAWYATTGSVGSRVFTFEWRNWYRFGGTTNTISFQALLYEGTSQVEFRYRQEAGVDASWSSIGIGITSGVSGGGINNFASLNAATASPGVSQQTSTQFSSLPPTNTSYVFQYNPGTPKVAAPSGISFANVTANSMDLQFVDNAANETGFQIWRSTNGVSYSLVSTVAASAGTGSTVTYSNTALSGSLTWYFRVIAIAENVAGDGVASPILSGSQALNIPCNASGTYTIGATGTYASITAAMAALALSGLNGPVVLELQTDYSPASESYPVVLGWVPCASSVNTITIRPASGVSTTIDITSAVNNATATTLPATLRFDGGSFITIDGRPGGTGSTSRLTFSNTNTGNTNDSPAILFVNDAQGNTLRYLTVRSGTTSSTSGAIKFFTASASGLQGNDNNTIQNCNITGIGVQLTYGIYSTGTTTNNATCNGNITVQNNNIFDFFFPGGTHGAIFATSGNTNWTVSNNKIYSTASRAMTLASTIYGIRVENTTNGFGNTVSGNTIGYASNSGTGTMTYTAGARFCGISVSQQTAQTAASIQGNTVAGISLAAGGLTNGTTTAPGVFSGIYTLGGGANIGNTTANTIGLSSAPITANCNTTASASFGINSTASGTGDVVNISNNSVGFISIGSNSATVNHQFTGIQQSGSAATITISGNTVGHTSTANAIDLTVSAGTGNNAFNGIINSGGGATSATISNNLIANIRNQAASTATTSRTLGILGSSGVLSITGNTIRNMASATRNTTTLTSAAITGIVVTSFSTTNGYDVSNNTIHSLSLTDGTSLTLRAYGIYFSTTTAAVAHTINANYIHSISMANTNASSELYGIYTAGGGTNIRISNNRINLGNDAAGGNVSGVGMIAGIYDAIGCQVVYNSVYIGGTASAAAGTAMYSLAYRTSLISTTRTLRNNALYNARVNGTNATGQHYIVNAGASSGLSGQTISNNAYFNTSGTGQQFCILSNTMSTTGATRATWTTTVSDANSIFADPGFGNVGSGVTAATLNMLIPSGASSSPLESRGVVLTAPTVDYAGTARPAPGAVNGGGTAPDIGANEFDRGLPTCTGPVAITASAALGTFANICQSTATTLGSSIPSTDVGFNYQWKVSTTSGGPYTNVPSAGTSASYSVPTTAAPGTYYYVVENNCTPAPGTPTVSNELTVYVNPTPVISITPSANQICGTGSVTLTASNSGPGTTGYTWTGGTTPTTGSIVTASPTVTTGYSTTGSVTYTNAGNNVTCSAAPVSVVIPVYPAFSVTATATPSSFCSGGSSSLNATASQASYYQVTSIPYSLRSSGSPSAGPVGDDVTSTAIALPFTINFMGATYTSVYIQTNGFIQFSNDAPGTSTNAPGTSYGSTFPTAGTNVARVGGIWEDLNVTGAGTCTYFTTGISPNQVFTIDWSNVPFYVSTGAVSFQIQVYQNGTVEVHIGSVNTSGVSQTYYTGIQNAAGTTGLGAPGRNSGSADILTPEAWRFNRATPTISYAWTPATYLSNPNIQAPTASGVSGSITYTVTATASSGCTASTTQTINTGTLTVNPTASPFSVCEGGNVTLTSGFSGGAAPYTYAWDEGGTAVGTATNSITLTPSFAGSPHTYNVTVTDNCAQSVTGSVNVIVYQNPTIGATKSGDLCGTGNVTLTASGATSYTWSPGGPGSPITVSPASTTTYTVTGVDANSCSGTATVTVNVNPVPTVTAVAALPAVCNGGSVALTGNALVNTTFVSSSIPYAAQTPSSPTTISQFQGFGGNTTDDGWSVAIATPFPISFYGNTFTSMYVNTNGFVQLSNDAPGANTLAAGSGAFYGSIIPSAATPNNIIAGVWEDLNVTAGSTVTYFTNGVSPNRVFVISYNAVPFYVSSGAATFQIQMWENGYIEVHIASVNTGGASQSFYTGVENSTGTSGVAATGRNPLTSAANITTPEAWRFAGAPVAGATFSWTNTGSALTYTASNTVQNPTASGLATPDSPITFTVTGTTPAGCSSTGTATVTVGQSLAGSVTSNFAAQCFGLAFNFTSAITGGGQPYSYSWTDNGSAVTGSSANLTYTPSTAGSHVIQVSVTDACSNTYSTSVTVTVNPLPVMSVTPNGGSLCSGATTGVSMTASGAGAGGTYAWTPGTGLSSVNTAATVALPSSTTVYTVTGTNSNGCVGTTTTTVTVNPVPTVSATAALSTVCLNQGTTLTGSAALAPQVSAIAFAYQTPSGATTAGPTGDDITSAQLALPFTFNFLGTSYNNFFIQTNGFIALGTTAPGTTYGTAIPNTAVPNAIVAGVWEDLNVISGTGSIRYFTNGVAPNRIFVIEWINTQFYVSTGNINFQIQLFENGGANGYAEVHIQNVTVAGTTQNFYTGVENATGSQGVAASGRNPYGSTADITIPEAYRFQPGTATYTWSWSPTTFITSPTETQQVATTNNMTTFTAYSVTATVVGTGCSATSNTLGINVAPPLTATINANATQRCDQQTLTLTATSSGGGTPYSYVFTVDGVAQPSQSSATFVTPALSVGSHTFSYIVTDNCGASTTSNTLTVPVYPFPVISVTPTVAALCGPGSVTLTASSDQTPTTYSWSPATNLNVTTGATVIASPNVTTTYTVTGTYQGCATNFARQVTYAPAVNITASSATPNTICQGGNSTLTATAQNAEPTYLVNTVAYSAYTAPGGATVLATGGTTSGSFTGSTDDGYWTSVPVGFTFNYYGTNLSSLAIGTNGYLMLNPGALSTSFSPSAIPSAATLPNGAIYFSWADLTVSSGVVRYWTQGSSPSRIFVAEFVNVPFLSGTGSVSCQIALYEGSNNIDIITINNSNGVATKVMGIENQAGTLATPVPGRNASIWGPVTNETYRFSPYYGNFSYSWVASTSPDYLSSNSGQTVFAQAVETTPGMSYTVTATENSGCFATAVVNLTVNARPSASITGNSTVCVGDVNLLNSNAVAGSGTLTSYQWRRNGSNISGATSDTYSATQTGTYAITLQNSNGCQSTSTSAPDFLVSPTNVYTVDATAGTNGSFGTAGGPAGITSYECGTNVDYFVLADACYEIASLVVDGSNVTLPLHTTNYTVSFPSIAASHTIVVTFAQSQFDVSVGISAVAGATGTVTPLSSSVLCGNNQSLVITPGSCSEIQSIIVNGNDRTSEVAVSGGTLSLTNITTDQSVSVVFRRISYSVTSTASPVAGGTVTTGGTFLCGATPTFSIVANPGYNTTGVEIWKNGSLFLSLGVVTSVQFTGANFPNGVDANYQVRAFFAVSPYNNNWATPLPISAFVYPSCYYTSGSLAGATPSPQASYFTSIPAGSYQDVWYRFQLPAASIGIVRIQVKSTVNNVGIVLQQDNGTPVATENDPSNLVGDEYMTVQSGLTPGAIYRVGVRNMGNQTAGAFQICITYIRANACVTGNYNLCGTFLGAYTGANSYTFTFTNQANPAEVFTKTLSGSGGGAASSAVVLTSVPGLRYGVVYNVKVDATYILNNGAGLPTSVLVSGANPTCVMTMTAQPTTELAAADRCPANKIGASFISTDWVCGVVDYQWEITPVGQTPGGAFSVTTMRGAASRFIRVGSLTGIAAGQWQVRVRPYFASGTAAPPVAGTYGPAQCMNVVAPVMPTITNDPSAFANLNTKSLSQGAEVALYPNPNAGEMVNINMMGIKSDNVQIRVIDGLGRMIYNKRYVVDGSLNTVLTFDQPLASGLYMVEYIYNGETHSQRMMVQR